METNLRIVYTDQILFEARRYEQKEYSMNNFSFLIWYL